jgi:hypothetical protein
MLQEQREDGAYRATPENPGLPAAIPYGPRATIKLRQQTPNIGSVM